MTGTCQYFPPVRGTLAYLSELSRRPDFSYSSDFNYIAWIFTSSVIPVHPPPSLSISQFTHSMYNDHILVYFPLPLSLNKQVTTDVVEQEVVSYGQEAATYKVSDRPGRTPALHWASQCDQGDKWCWLARVHTLKAAARVLCNLSGHSIRIS